VKAKKGLFSLSTTSVLADLPFLEDLVLDLASGRGARDATEAGFLKIGGKPIFRDRFSTDHVENAVVSHNV